VIAFFDRMAARLTKFFGSIVLASSPRAPNGALDTVAVEAGRREIADDVERSEE
jgi:hypothetical protein